MDERLTRDDWIRHGLRTLSKEGSQALKVGSMAERLNVSRGSFYWHFRDVGAFRAALLQSWREVSTDQVIRDLDARPGDPERLKRLLRTALNGPRRLDRAMRSWAGEDAKVAKVVASVDAARIERIAGLLVEAGLDVARSSHRAAFLYWAYLGQASVIGSRRASIPDWALDEIGDLFATKALPTST